MLQPRLVERDAVFHVQSRMLLHLQKLPPAFEHMPHSVPLHQRPSRQLLACHVLPSTNVPLDPMIDRLLMLQRHSC